MGGGPKTPLDGAADAIPVGDDGFVVVEEEQEASHANLPTTKAGSAQAAPTRIPPPASPPPSSGSASPTESPTGGSSGAGAGGAAPAEANLPRFDAAADAVAEAGEQLYKFLYAYAAAACAFVRAHATVAFQFVYAHAVMAFEFVYAYAAASARAARSLLEGVRSRAGSAWRSVEDRSPASVKRAMSHRFAPAVALALLMVVPAYWAMPRGGSGDSEQYRLSAEDWQAKHDLLSSKYSGDAVRQRLKYDSLAGRHMELQQEYETLLKEFKNQQRAARAGRNGSKSQETCSSKTESVLGPVKEAFKAAEQSTYEYLAHFSEGLREDVREVKGLLQRKTRSWLEGLR